MGITCIQSLLLIYTAVCANSLRHRGENNAYSAGYTSNAPVRFDDDKTKTYFDGGLQGPFKINSPQKSSLTDSAPSFLRRSRLSVNDVKNKLYEKTTDVPSKLAEWYDMVDKTANGNSQQRQLDVNLLENQTLTLDQNSTPRNSTPRNSTPRNSTPRNSTPRNSTPRNGTHTDDGSEDVSLLDENISIESYWRKCRLTVIPKSSKQWANYVLDNGYEMIIAYVAFDKSISIPGNRTAINYRRWTWTYGGQQRESSEYTQLPVEAGIWSLGFLFTKTKTYKGGETLIIKSKNCNNTSLIVGNQETDNLVGEALADMVLRYLVPNNKNKYNTTYWCYLEKKPIKSHIKNILCQQLFCPFKVVQFVCCKYDFNENGKIQLCSRTVQDSSALWWIIPFATGLILFLYWPIFFLSIYERLYQSYYPVKDLSKRDRLKHVTDVSDESSVRVSNREDSLLIAKVTDSDRLGEFVFFQSDKPPIGIIGTIFSPLKLVCPSSSVSISRIVRFLFSLFSLLFIMIEIGLDQVFLKPYIISCIKADVPLGFRTMAAGYLKSKDVYLTFLGGPYVAVGLFLVIFWISLIPPTDLAELAAQGVSRYDQVKSPLVLPMELKQMLGSVNILDKTGYCYVRSVLLANVYMLINFKFWSLCWYLFMERFFRLWKMTCPNQQGCFMIVRLFVFILITPLFMCVCLIELSLAVLYYACPTLQYTLIYINAVKKAYFRYLRIGIFHTRYQYAIRLTMSLLYSIAFTFAMFMFCLIFLESFLFLSRVALFTFTGIVRYPRESYGWIILFFMATYYLVESCSYFGNMYSKLLRETIHAVKVISKRQFPDDLHSYCKKDSNGRDGIKTDLFEFVIERIRPRRVQMVMTLLKFGTTFFILMTSIFLIQYFNNAEELSIIVQVFSIMFVCAIPIIFKTAFKHNEKEKLNLKLLRRELRYLVLEYRKRMDEAMPVQVSSKQMLHMFSLPKDTSIIELTTT